MITPLTALQAMIDIAHLLRPAHLQQLSSILKDPEASQNDRFVALELLKNANIASGMILPGALQSPPARPDCMQNGRHALQAARIQARRL